MKPSLIKDAFANTALCAQHAAAVTVPFTTSTPTRALAIGVAGDITVTMASGASVTITVTAGFWPLAVTAISAATATGIVALY